MAKDNTIFWVMGIVVVGALLFFGNSSLLKDKGDILKIKFYDENKNEILPNNNFAIVNDAENVHFIKLFVTVINTGNVEYNNQHTSGGDVIDSGVGGMVRIYGQKEIVDNFGGCSWIDPEQQVWCMLPVMQPGETKSFETSFIDLSNLNYDEYLINVIASVNYRTCVDCSNSPYDETLKTLSETSSTTINVQPNPISPGVSVSIGSSPLYGTAVL